MIGYSENAMLKSDTHGADVEKVPELGRLKHASERLALASENVERFLYRFHGPRQETSEKQAPTPLAQDSYRNDIATLFEQLAKLESLVVKLDAIG